MLQFDLSLLELGDLSKLDSKLDKSFWLDQLISSFMIFYRSGDFALQIEKNNSVSDADFNCVLVEESSLAVENAPHTLLQHL